MAQPDDYEREYRKDREERRRARELSHYITKAEALALVTNLLERHQRLHHAPGGFWRRTLDHWRTRRAVWIAKRRDGGGGT